MKVLPAFVWAEIKKVPSPLMGEGEGGGD